MKNKKKMHWLYFSISVYKSCLVQFKAVNISPPKNIDLGTRLKWNPHSIFNNFNINKSVTEGRRVVKISGGVSAPSAVRMASHGTARNNSNRMTRHIGTWSAPLDDTHIAPVKPAIYATLEQINRLTYSSVWRAPRGLPSQRYLYVYLLFGCKYLQLSTC